MPGQCPDVLSAGGVFLHPDGALEASDYSSGLTSKVYPDRIVPDVCGLVGMRPRGVYLMLPTAPGCVLDHEVATLGGYPAGDEIAADDGWVGLSGMPERYDVIVVGARCAGTPTAMLLARQGTSRPAPGQGPVSQRQALRAVPARQRRRAGAPLGFCSTS